MHGGRGGTSWFAPRFRSSAQRGLGRDRAPAGDDFLNALRLDAQLQGQRRGTFVILRSS